AFAIPLDGEDVPAVSSPAGPALAQHLRDQVDAKDLDVGQGGPEPGREQTGSAPHVEDLGWLIPHHLTDPADQDPVGRTEDQPLEDATIVAVAPAGELLARLVLVVSHNAASVPSVAESHRCGDRNFVRFARTVSV